MGSFGWRLRELMGKLVPWAIVGAIAYGGLSLYQEGAFRRGLKPAITRALYKVPYFGTRFRHYRPGKKNVARGHKHYRGKKARHHRRGRRHHRRHR